MICPRCGTEFSVTASACPSCGTPTAPAGVEERVATAGTVLEPEVLESLDELEHPGARGPRGEPQGIGPIGCTLGPGCGCIGLPLAVLAGVVVSSAIALLWVLSLGRLPSSIAALAARARRGFTRR